MRNYFKRITIFGRIILKINPPHYLSFREKNLEENGLFRSDVCTTTRLIPF